jgi:hypothetical protein
MAEDFLNGDHSFKKWFKIMWSNGYIALFIVAAIAFGAILFTLQGSELWISILPVAMMAVIAYKGFYQFWNDLKNGRSR